MRVRNLVVVVVVAVLEAVRSDADAPNAGVVVMDSPRVSRDSAGGKAAAGREFWGAVIRAMTDNGLSLNVIDN